MTDPTAFRVTLICKCATDAAEGYGPTIEEAEAAAFKFWRRGQHKKRDIACTIREQAVTKNGSSHYEEI